MKKILVGTKVHVDAEANQYPYERIAEDGVVIDTPAHGGYVIYFKRRRESLFFLRKDLTILPG